MQSLNKHIFLILSLLALGLSVIFYSTLERGAINATDEQYLRATQQRIRQELAVSAGEIKAIGEKLKQISQYTFDDLDTTTKYPYFVYRDQPGKETDLLFWADQQFVPPFNQLKSQVYPYLATFPQGQYLVNRYQVRKGTDLINVFSLITVYRHYQNETNYLQSGYNSDLFALDPQRIATAKVGTYQNMYDSKPTFLFSVVPPKMDAYRNHSSPISTVILATLGMFFMGIYLIRRTLNLRMHRHYGAGFVILALYLFGLRAVMLYFGVPFLFVETELFNPKFYSASVIAPSLGDLMLNCLIVVVLALYLVNTYYRSRSYYWLLRQPHWVKVGISLVTVMLSYGVFYYCLQELKNIYENSHFTLDITLSISFPGLKVVCLLISLLIVTVYFLFTQVLTSLFIRLNVAFGRGMIWIALGTALTLLLFWQLNSPLSGVLLLHALYFVMLYGSRFPRTLYAFRYRTSIYLFSAALVGAAMSTYVIYYQEIKRDIASKREFGAQLLAENDAFGEFLINKARTATLQDKEIRLAFTNDTLLARERVQERIKTVHLNKYLDRFTTEITLFDLAGRPLNQQIAPLNLAYYTSHFRLKRYQTQYPDLYFINEEGSKLGRQYVQFLDVRNKGLLIGHIVLTVKLGDESPRNTYPELLVDNRFIQAPETRSYSYAIYNAGKQLVYSSGNYNYERKLPTSLLSDSLLYEKGTSYKNYKHVGVYHNNRTVVISSPDYLIRNIFANFSFSYLVLILYVLVLMLLYAFRYRVSQISVNYATKTQIFLNVAFFLPLTLVVVITLGVISSNFATNQENAYINTTKNIVSNFLPYLKDYQQGKVSKEYMEEELRKIARDAELDINLFNPSGQLYSSTQPLIYETGYLSKYINPKAYIHLIEDKENQVVLNESLGSKEFQTVYVGIKSYDGQLLGVLGIPHFDSQSELERQLIEVISTALSVFIGLFLVFLLLSYWASTILTKPLKLITQKIRKTNLDKLNEPLDWRSDDEIGLLIGEYNRMLIKLEEKKQALSQSEKQAAWREMAKQVAHEIKNPLTPMKLTLQHLQRTLANNDNPNAKRILQRTLDSLLDQIDNLSDIAASFSDFAKMPLPKNDLFEITSVFNKAADLYSDDKNIELIREVPTHPITVMGDRQLIGRILTNLIINGVQSVPSARKPIVKLKLSVSDENISIEIQDNGVGIPEAIRNKIFLPNFSTKQGGSGLGLAIAKRGVEHAGGSIWFETETNEGTTFFITLPLVHSSEEIVPLMDGHKL